MGVTHHVRIEFKTRAARAWVRFVAFAAPLLGRALAERIALRGAMRLTRYRVHGATKWSPLP